MVVDGLMGMADVPAPVLYDEGPASYQLFGVNWVHRVLHLDRILATVDQVLGDQLALGPIGAGPGRAFASISFVGTFHPTTGHQIPAELLTYAINLPISVVFDLDLPMDRLTFNGEVIIPLVMVVHTEEPLRLRLEIRTPTEEQIQLQLHTDTRRGTVIRKVAGIDGELRRFVLKVIDTELNKPYVQKAMNLDMEELIAEAWPALTQQFLPRGPEDRRSG